MRFRWLAIFLLLPTTALAQPSRYEIRKDHDPSGIGKFYMGREIAHVMSHFHAGWLDRKEREKEEEPSKLLPALKIKPGSVVADIGCGSGYYTMKLAEAVGPKGKVLANDIQPEMLAIVRKKMKDKKLTNIEPVLCTEIDPKLPAGQVDMILMVDVYHEFSHPYEVTAALVKSLAPGGRLVFVEFRLEDAKVPINLLHKMSKSQVIKEMQPHAVRHVETLDLLPWQHVVIFEKKADWPLFRGNALQSGTVVAPLPDPLEVRWKVAFKDAKGAPQDIESTAAIVGDTVYVGCFDEHLYALDLATGKEKWRYKATDSIKCPVSVSRGAVYVGDDGGVLHCVDAKTGKKIWTFATDGEIAGGANFHGDKVLIGSHDATLYCLARKDGSVLWKFKTQGMVNGSALVDGDRTFVAGCDSDLHVLDVNTGQEVAKVDLKGQAAATASILGDKLYVGTMTNEVQAVDLKKMELQWSYAPKRAREFYASTAVTDKLVLAGCRDKLLHAINRKTGMTAWTFAAKNRIDSSPVVAGQRVYFGSSDGNLYVVDLAKGTQVQKLELGRSIVASPAVAHDCLVIGTTDGELYCLGAKK